MFGYRSAGKLVYGLILELHTCITDLCRVAGGDVYTSLSTDTEYRPYVTPAQHVCHCCPIIERR